MSNSIYPVLPGLQFDIKKRPIFNSTVHRSVSGTEVRTALQVYPLWEFSLSYSRLRDTPGVTSPAAPFNELKQLLGFFLNRQGQFDNFLFDDVTDDVVTDMQFAIGDGANAAWQLTRSYGGFSEPVQNLNGAVTNIKDNNSTVNPANYSVGSTGLVTFSPVIANGHVLTWTGAYYYRCRFLTDVEEFNEFMSNLWELQTVDFVGSVGNKV